MPENKIDRLRNMSLPLGAKQELFAESLALLIHFATFKGYQVRMGAVQEEREFGLHPLKLAADINLFRGKTYLRKTDDHKELGLFWESLSDMHCWGGRFEDGNHYSITHAGMK